MKKVVVGMSGGVDSSVAAYLLKKEGYEVIGLFMKNWEEKNSEGICQSTIDYEDAAKVCHLLKIPLYTVNFVKEYWDLVFSNFIKQLQLGYTPNPDILCNKEIKFDTFFTKAKSLGADFLATGHYCQNIEGQLAKGIDPEKDQSYFLYAIKKGILSQVLFPLGTLMKQQVRKIAQEANIPTHEKKDSTGICFIGKRKFKPFIQNYIPYHPGNFQTLDKEIVGQHDGAAYYTIGQRKGLGIGGAGDPWFVVDKDMKKNIVYVVQGQNHPALFAKKVTGRNSTFIPPYFPFPCQAKIRYRQKEQECRIETLENDLITVSFSKPQRAVTPRQSIVFYNGSFCMGGAFIEKAL